MSGNNPRPEWTDRRFYTYGFLSFAAGVVTYAVVWYPLASADTLIANTVASLVAACVFVVTGYTAGRLVEKHRALKGEQQDEEK